MGNENPAEGFRYFARAELDRPTEVMVASFDAHHGAYGRDDLRGLRRLLRRATMSGRSTGHPDAFRPGQRYEGQVADGLFETGHPFPRSKASTRGPGVRLRSILKCRGAMVNSRSEAYRSMDSLADGRTANGQTRNLFPSIDLEAAGKSNPNKAKNLTG